ncbi:MAG: alkaline phosphatase family protein [Ginsengibacter sp.]
MQNKIKHVFVIMFENRSFDHILGFSGIKGSDVVTGNPTEINGLQKPEDFKSEFPSGSGKYIQPTPDAPTSLSFDPPHEFLNTLEQLCGKGAAYEKGNYPQINNSGFAISYADAAKKEEAINMQCFAPKDVPIITQLATEFAVCDNWFSSVPGPTWPNRFFLHAATSGGMDDSPIKRVQNYSNFMEEFNFENGNIFQALQRKGIPWMIYEGDQLPQCFALSGMHKFSDSHIRPFRKFRKDIRDKNYAPQYIFIEPCYGHVLTDGTSFRCGNSQHPLDDIRRGELLLKEIYESIRNSPLWESSCLVITYDEHGGFFDHVIPPKAVPPGDKCIHESYNRHNFTFDQLGVRVPAVIVSPFVKKNTIDHTLYDHTSVLKTLENWLDLSSFTERDKKANSFEHLFSLDEPRTDTPEELKRVNYIDIRCKLGIQKITNFLANFLVSRLKEISPTAIGFLYVALLKKSHIDKVNKNEIVEKYNSVNNPTEASQFIDEAKKQISINDQKKQSVKDLKLQEMNEGKKV